MGEYFGTFRAPEEVDLGAIKERLSAAEFPGWEKQLFVQNDAPAKLYYGFAGSSFPDPIPESEIALQTLSTDAWGIPDEAMVETFDAWTASLAGDDWARATAKLDLKIEWLAQEEIPVEVNVGWVYKGGTRALDVGVRVTAPLAFKKRRKELVAEIAFRSWTEVLEGLKVDAAFEVEDTNFRVISERQRQMSEHHPWPTLNPWILRFARAHSALDEFRWFDSIRQRRGLEWQPTLGLNVSTGRYEDRDDSSKGLGNRLWGEVARTGLSRGDDIRVSGNAAVREWDEVARALAASQIGGIEVAVAVFNHPEIERPAEIYLRGNARKGCHVDVRVNPSVSPTQIRQFGDALGVTFPNEPTEIW